MQTLHWSFISKQCSGSDDANLGFDFSLLKNKGNAMFCETLSDLLEFSSGYRVAVWITVVPRSCCF